MAICLRVYFGLNGLHVSSQRQGESEWFASDAWRSEASRVLALFLLLGTLGLVTVIMICNGLR